MNNRWMRKALAIAVMAVIWAVYSEPLLAAQRYVEVAEEEIMYQPDTIKIKRGQTIRVINKDPFFHASVISKVDKNGMEGMAVFPRHMDKPDTRFEFTFTELGTYRLRCLIHDGMIAEIQVVEE